MIVPKSISCRPLLAVSISLIFCFFCSTTNAQNNHYRDSLWRLVQSAKEDTAKIDLYLLYGDLFRLTQPDSATLFYEKAGKLADRLHFNRGTTSYISHYIEVLNNKGLYTQALALCEQSVKLNQQMGNQRDLARAYNNVANEYQYLGALSSASEYYLKAIRISEDLHAKPFLKVLSNNLASVFLELQQYDKAYTYASRSNSIARELHDTNGIASSLVNKGIAELHLSKLSEAMQHFRETVWYGRYLKDYTFEEDGYLNMAELNTRQKNIDSAIVQNQHALDMAITNDNPNYKVLSLGGLADDYSALGNWPKANGYIMQAIAIAEQIQDRNSLDQLYTRASRIREGLKDYKGALLYKNKYAVLNDSLLNEKTRDHINDLETRYQTAQKDKAIAEQQLQLENTKAIVRKRNTQLWLMGSGVAVLLLISLLIVRLYRQRQKLNNQKLLSIQKEQEVTLLKAVLEGQEQERQRIAREMHDDMGSGLTTILYLCQDLNYSKVLQQENTGEKIASTARSLTSKMNEIIWSMNREYDTLEDLVAYIRHNASEMLENTSMDYGIQVPENIPAITLSGKARRNIYLVVKEALHNAMKHAQANFINIDIKVNRHLQISVHDNGCGIATGNERRFGNGLQNMRARMDTIGGTLDIQSQQGTTVQLTVPLTANELPA